MLRHRDLNDLSRTAVEPKSNRSCNHRLMVWAYAAGGPKMERWGLVIPGNTSLPTVVIMPQLVTLLLYWSLYYALVMRRTVLQDLSVLAVRKTTMQINSRPTEIIISLESKWRFALVMSSISTNQTSLRTRVSVRVRCLGLGLGLGLGFIRLLSCV